MHLTVKAAPSKLKQATSRVATSAQSGRRTAPARGTRNRKPMVEVDTDEDLEQDDGEEEQEAENDEEMAEPEEEDDEDDD